MDEVLERAGIGAEGHSAGVNVGAGDVEFVGGDAFRIVETRDDLEIVADRVAENVDDDFALGVALHRREFLCEVVDDADILQADGVQHAGRGLDDARRGVAGHGFKRDTLGDEGAQAIESDDLFEFDAVAEGAAGGDDRVHQFNTGQRNSHVGFHARVSSLPAGCRKVIRPPQRLFTKSK